MSMLLGNPEWSKPSVYADDPPEPEDLSPLDNDYVREKYRDEEW